MNDPEFSKKRLFFKQFIRLYESFPCLWNIKSPQYRDRELRTAAYKVLSRKLQEIQPGADRMAVVKKINCFRSNVRKEKRKILEGVKVGRVVKPKLWYHHHFNFLNGIIRNTEPEFEGVDNIKIKSPTFVAQIKMEDKDDPSDTIDIIIDESNQDGNYLLDLNTEEARRPSYDVELLQTHPANSTTEPNHKLITENYRRQELDRHDVFGKNVAMKLRHISSTNDTQRIMAEKIINEALYMAEMSLLSLDHNSIDKLK